MTDDMDLFVKLAAMRYFILFYFFPGALMQKMSILVALCLLPAACATVNTDTNAERKEQKQFVTGSNIGKKDAGQTGVRSASRETLETLQSRPGKILDPTGQ